MHVVEQVYALQQEAMAVEVEMEAGVEILVTPSVAKLVLQVIVMQ
jgi:hypothetical protein